MIIHMIQSTVNNSLKALSREGEGRKTDPLNITYSMYQL